MRLRSIAIIRRKVVSSRGVRWTMDAVSSRGSGAFDAFVLIRSCHDKLLSIADQRFDWLIGAFETAILNVVVPPIADPKGAQEAGSGLLAFAVVAASWMLLLTRTTIETALKCAVTKQSGNSLGRSCRGVVVAAVG